MFFYLFVLVELGTIVGRNGFEISGVAIQEQLDPGIERLRALVWQFAY